MRPAEKTATVELVRSLPLFHALDGAPLSEIADAARTVEINRGRILIERGMALDGFYAVLRGRLKIYLLSCNGAERVIRLLTPGDCFGEAIMFNALPSPVYVQALTDAELCYFPKQHVYATLREQPGFMRAMLAGLSQLLHQLIGDLEACCMQNARQRIAHYLLCQAGQSRGTEPVVQLPASKSLVASTLNLSAETFSRELHKLARDGLVTVQRRTVRILDHERLQGLAEHGDAAPPAH